MRKVFETIIEQKKLGLSPKIHAEILKTALQLEAIDPSGKKWSKKNYRKGYTSYGSLSNLHQQFSVFESLKKNLDREVILYCKKLGLQFTSGHLGLSSMWVNVMPKQCYHAFHFHPLSVVSGTYYLQVPKNSGPLRIEDPRAAMFMASPARKIQLDLIPKVGEVILFESWLKHEVPPHDGPTERVSVSFNYDWFDR